CGKEKAELTQTSSRLLRNTFEVASAKAGHLRRFFLPPSYFILSSGADLQGGQRNLPEGLFVLLEIKRSAGMMTGSAICDFSLLTSQFLLLTFLTSALGYFRLTNSLLNSKILPLSSDSLSTLTCHAVVSTKE